MKSDWPSLLKNELEKWRSERPRKPGLSRNAKRSSGNGRRVRDT